MVFGEMKRGDQETVISGRNIIKFLGKNQIIHQINFDFRRSRIYIVVGRNGSGKSTFLKLILGLLSCDSGELNIQDNITIASALENDNLYERMSGYDNIEMFFLFKNRTYSKEKEKDYLDKMHLNDHMEKLVSSYSKGMKKKLALMIALLCDAEVIILDEPFSGLDKESKRDLFDLLNVEKSKNKTIILVSHELDSMERNWDELFLMEEGYLKNITGGSYDRYV